MQKIKVNRYKKTGATVVVAFMCVVGLLPFYSCAKQVVLAPYDSFCVVIDAGHGGIDGGGIGKKLKLKESDVNLNIAKKLEKTFCFAGFNTVMTRSSQGGLYGILSHGFKKRDMQKRAQIINDANATAVVSIHQNTCTDLNRRGAQVYYKQGDASGFALAENICKRLNTLSQRGRDCTVLAADFYILNVSPCASVIVECGFLSNAEDEKLLADDNYCEQLSREIMYGVTSYLMNIYNT